MARKLKRNPATAPILYCPECGLPRQGPNLLKHCIAKHAGRLPVVLNVEDADYARAIALLAVNDKPSRKAAA